MRTSRNSIKQPVAAHGWVGSKTVPGFALVVTISMMVLLTLLCVGLLSLSTVSLRATSSGRAKQEAMANARMALGLAIAEIQKQLGPDQRVTAPASLLESKSSPRNSEWVGVWDPRQSGEKGYDSGRPDSFRKWLVSHEDNDDLSLAKGDSLQGEAGVDIAGVEGDLPVRAGLIPVDGGGFAWWVGDESMKARVNLTADPSQTEYEDLVARHFSPERAAPELITGMEPLEGLANDEVERLISRETVGLVTGRKEGPGIPPAREFLTSNSMSLPVDVIDGGFKKDINTLFELEPDKIDDRKYGVWEGRGAKNSRNAYLYGRPGITLGARWNHLYTYYNLYKKTSYENDVPILKPEGSLIDWNLADQYRDFGDEAGGFRFPRIAKIIYVFSYASDRAQGSQYKLKLVTDIFVTVWNPFNARIQFPANTSMFIKMSKEIPMSFEWRLDGRVRGNVRLGQMFGGGAFMCTSPMKTSPSNRKAFEMDPGETLMFSMKNTRNPIDIGTGTSSEPFYPGVGYRGGFSTTKVLGSGRELTGSAGSRVSVSLKPRNDAKSYNIDGVETSQYVDFWVHDNSRGQPYYEHRGEIIARSDTPFTRRMPEVSHKDIRSVSLSEVSSRKQPFGAFIMEIKTAADSVEPSLAFLHSGISRLSSRVDRTEGHAANERFEYKLEPVTGWDSDIIQTTLSTHPYGPNHGFVGSGRTFQTGQTHVATSAIPILPVMSISQFKHAGVGDGASVIRATHWGFNSTPLAPYVDCAVGNSYAHPLIPRDRSSSRNYFDQSYLANEALWDGYFCSSLSQQTGRVFKSRRSLGKVWEDFVKGDDDLLNSRYVLWKGRQKNDEIIDEVVSGTGASALKDDAYLKIGSRLMIKGGFNVNSTSVEAWTALLASCRKETVMINEPSAGRVKITREKVSGTPFGRSALVMGGAVEDSPGDVGLHYRGFRELDDDQIRDLAESIVEQVRERGPFRSMSEFINRQLNRDSVDLSLKGALQAAIDETDINDPLKAHGVAVGDVTRKGYAFPEAAKGNTATGAPGWLSQGDLLDSLGPMITVRGDTFVVRGYGESRGSDGAVTARAVCESVVQRVPDYLDPQDDAENGSPKRGINKRMGRKFEVVSFRWLSQSEV